MTTEVRSSSERPRVIGRYALFGEIAAGGMATVHFGRLVGPAGFSRTVAIKRLHPHFAKDPEFVSMLLDEARLASRIQHPNVVSTLDIVDLDDEVFLVMEYVAGESLARLIRRTIERQARIPVDIVVSILSGVLYGLHAAHEAKSEHREPLNIVHRDVSPQNVLVGTDGVARVLDFGVAKAAMRAQSTRDGQMKGKLSYMSPQQLNGEPADRRADIFAAGIVLWEALCGRRLFQGSDAGETFGKVLAGEIPEPKTLVEDLPDELNRVTMKALERDVEARYPTAREFAVELEGAAPIATARAVGEWVEELASPELEQRQHRVAEIEARSAELEDLVAREESGPRALPGVEDGAPAFGARESSSLPARSSRPSVPIAPELPGSLDPNRLSHSSISSPSAMSSPTRPDGLRPGRSPGSRRALWVLGATMGGGLAAWLIFGAMFDEPEREGRAVLDRRRTGNEAEAPGIAAVDAALEPPTLSLGDLPPAPDEPDTAGGVSSPAPGEPLPAATSKALPAEVEARHSPPPPTGRRRPAEPAPKPEESCNPPWTVDEQGIRRLKPECL